jgi:hypothetical protein
MASCRPRSSRRAARAPGDCCARKACDVYAEFNTLHVASYLDDHPDAAPIGVDGQVSPPPEGWQGICPTHDAYRAFRMDAFRELLEDFAIDGVWLDYHHAMPVGSGPIRTCPTPASASAACAASRKRRRHAARCADVRRAALLLSTHRDAWVRWRSTCSPTGCASSASDGRHAPGRLLGTFHNPWSDEDFDGARLEKLAIDLKAQAPTSTCSARCRITRGSATWTTRRGFAAGRVAGRVPRHQGRPG